MSGTNSAKWKYREERNWLLRRIYGGFVASRALLPARFGRPGGDGAGPGLEEDL